MEDLGAFYLSWFGQIISHNLTLVAGKDPLIWMEVQSEGWWNIAILGPEIGGSSLLMFCFLCFLFMDFLVKSHTETPMEVFFLDVLGFWVPQKTWTKN